MDDLSRDGEKTDSTAGLLTTGPRGQSERGHDCTCDTMRDPGRCCRMAPGRRGKVGRGVLPTPGHSRPDPFRARGAAESSGLLLERAEWFGWRADGTRGGG